MRTLLIILILLISSPLTAQTPVCDNLSGDAKALSKELLESQYPYDCCDETIAKCLSDMPECKLPPRLANYICRLAGEGKDKETIVRFLERRALSMIKPVTFPEIDNQINMMTGCTDGAVVVSVYLCARCPMCSELIPKLYHEITKGSLSGKIKLYARIFPIKSHKGGTEANLALAAASEKENFWEYLLYSYANFSTFSTEVIPDWAESVGLDRKTFNQLRKSPEVRQKVVASKKEGLRNGVESTPTFFINGRKYLGEIELETLIDVLEEELESQKN